MKKDHDLQTLGPDICPKCGGITLYVIACVIVCGYRRAWCVNEKCLWYHIFFYDMVPWTEEEMTPETEQERVDKLE